MRHRSAVPPPAHDRTALANPGVVSFPNQHPAVDIALLLICPDACRLTTVVSFRFAAASVRVNDGAAKSPKMNVLSVRRMLREAVVFWKHKSTLALEVAIKHPSCPVLHRELIELTPGSASPIQEMELDVVPKRLISGLPFERNTLLRRVMV